MLALFATGCASAPQQTSYVDSVNKAQAVVKNAKELENHTKLPEKHILPNILLEQSRVLYISWTAIAADSIGLRFGERDIVMVAKDAMNDNYTLYWAAMRNAKADKAKADAATEELKKIICNESIPKHREDKKDDEEYKKSVFNTVVGKMAQEDYIEYKNLIKKGEASPSDYEGQEEWMAMGKANAIKVAAAHKKMLKDAEKRLAAAEKDAAAARRKLTLILKYHGNKLALPAVKVGVAEVKKLLAGNLPPVAVNAAMPLIEAALLNTMISAMDEAQKEWPGVVTAFADSVEPFTMPQFSMEGVTVFNIKDKVVGYTDAVNKSMSDWLKKTFQPYDYALEIGGKRWDSFWAVKKWASEAQDALDVACDGQ